MARRRTVTGIRRSVGAVSKHRALSQGPPLAGESPLAAPPASLTAATSIPAPVPNAASDVAAPLTGQTAAFAVAPEDVVVHVTLVRGGITNVRVPVVIAGRYDGLPVAGSSKAFDRLLDSWITRAIDMGMVGSGLGQLFPVDLQARQAIGKANAAHLLLASMGEPGRFAQDGLRFLSSNITVAVKGLGYDQFATPLLGTRRREIPIGDAVHGVLEGILDGYERFRAIANSLIDDRERFRRAGQQPLYLVLVDPDEGKLREMQNALEVIGRERTLRGLKVDVEQGKDVPPDSIIESSAADTEQEAPVALLRVTRSRSPRAAVAPGMQTELFQFSAMSDRAAVPVREAKVNASLLRQLPERMINAASSKEREVCGTFFANVVIPDDFMKLTEGPGNLTLEVDETTASYPWEMVARKKYARTSFMGTSVCVSRQFRTVSSPPPCSPPAVNKVLKALIIADPAPGLELPRARAEGCAVVDTLASARRAWGNEYDLRATVRIGFRGDDTLAPLLQQLRSHGSWVESAEPCDPLELAMLIVNEQYDVIHYAGHAFFDKKANRAGWVFASDCFLTAQEIFRVRQVPRLVFANACFSAAVSEEKEQRKQLAGLAQAFFCRGIPNFIGAGWPVDDECAHECARWFYARVLGLLKPGEIGRSAPATIGEALREARRNVFAFNNECSSWGAYQHYGRASDRLLARPDSDAPAQASLVAAAKTVAVSIRTVSPPSTAGVAKMSTNAPVAEVTTAAADPNLVYVNGIDIETGKYAFAPRTIDDLARHVLAHPKVRVFSELHVERPRSFGVSFGMDPAKLDSSGWGIIFHKDTPQDVRVALDPLIKLRKQQAGNRFKALDYKKGEQTRAWYERHHMSAGSLDPEIVPYYLLLVGPPDLIPFDFQYLLGVEYAVGRLAFDTAAEYERYARSIGDYENANAIPNAKEIAFWGTRHLGDPATDLSASLLIDPLANGIAHAAGALKRPIHSDVGYDRKLHLADDATKDSLLTTLHAAKPPAMLFTASHGMAVRSGHPKQLTDQGALLCQDWPGFGTMRPDHYLAAADLADDANVKGMVAFLFACFGDGTPDADQFPMELSQAGTAPPLAPKPFVAALPRRLLAHPNGGALAVIGHIDRAWSFSIQTTNVPEAQIGTFRNTLGFVLSGDRVGNAIRGQFSARFAALSTALASSTSPTAPAAMHLSDRDLVTFWLERNDAQNYVVLGDPAVRIRTDVFA
jgi:CHAT domain